MFAFLIITVIVIIVTIKIKRRVLENKAEEWRQRINYALSGELGNKIRNQVNPQSEIYRVVDCGIIYYDQYGNEQMLWFANSGYENIPVQYTVFVCLWLQRYIVHDKENYLIEKMIHIHDYYEASNSYTVKKSVDGYSVKADPGKWETTESMMGYMLYHRSQSHKYSSTQKNLKKW